ncbi:MAG: hypothetical protein BGO45_10640 [Microbacterium sp. 71-36]|jgi:hypothetical protein|uniref:hypothetical protein n=1 Tax=unclassified Microbacterium TaxID=2609290 RepID=UPI00092C84AB|nr:MULTISPECIES: hypothetical protein [unclassified Microbacterium]MBN9210723.1 hypothetical protein [Microbacterium sp.]OJV77247.1 MAG: hypothetical protein BGO45_10640 [Microbacterium sp. 71-36]
MAAKTRYKVKAAQIVVKVQGAQGGEAYFRRGRRLPTTVEDEEIKRLLKIDLIEKDDEVEETDGAGGA